MTNNLPLVSVIIPSYNHAEYITESIQSIIDQDYENIELIIIDDGSRDNSVEVISKMTPICEKRFVRFEFRFRPNQGLCATLNEALEWCEGDYFSPIASDDIALPHKISFLVSKIESSDYSVVFGNIQNIGTRHFTRESPKVFEHVFSDLLMHISIPPAPAALLKTKDIRQVGGYNENFIIEDWYMWLKLTYNNKRLISYDEVVCLYRRHNSNTVNNDNLMYSAREQIINVYKSDPLYDAAFKKNLYLTARSKASYKVIQPIILILKAKKFDIEGLLVLIKSLTPEKAIHLKRFLLNKIKSTI